MSGSDGQGIPGKCTFPPPIHPNGDAQPKAIVYICASMEPTSGMRCISLGLSGQVTLWWAHAIPVCHRLRTTGYRCFGGTRFGVDWLEPKANPPHIGGYSCPPTTLVPCLKLAIEPKGATISRAFLGIGFGGRCFHATNISLKGCM